MPHQRSFRLGWQSQNLARFILYKFAFLAEPVQVADDIGIDFFCTLFDAREGKNNTALVPRNSFAIQIKSENNLTKIDLTGYIPYFLRMELPFFIGVVNRSDLTLTFYSGELLTPLFAFRGSPEYLEAELCERSTIKSDYSEWLKDISPKKYILPFPKITEISADIDDALLESSVKDVSEICSVMLENIASTINKEFILRGASSHQVLAFAGPGSFQVFEMNFFKRLSEVFFNLSWACSNDTLRHQSMKRFNLYENIYQLLKDHLGEDALPGLLREMYGRTKKIIGESNSHIINQ
jgi:hypothetical protein